MGDDDGGWTLPPKQSYTAWDNDGKSLGEYPTQLEADEAVKVDVNKFRDQLQRTTLTHDKQPDITAAPRVTTQGAFGKIFTFLGCAVLLVVGIFVALWIFGWVIATFVVK